MTHEQVRRMALAEERLRAVLAVPVPASCSAPLVIDVQDCDGPMRFEYAGAFITAEDLVVVCLLPKSAPQWRLPTFRRSTRAVRLEKLLKPKAWQSGEWWLCRATKGPQITVRAESEEGALSLWRTCMSGYVGTP